MNKLRFLSAALCISLLFISNKVFANPNFSVKTDVNMDGIVNQTDIDLVSSNYNKYASECDLNGDNHVDIYDLVLVSKDLNTPLFRVYSDSTLINEFKSENDAISYAQSNSNTKVVDSSGSTVWPTILIDKVYTQYNYTLTHMIDLQMTVSPQIETSGVWGNATRADVTYYVNPQNFINDNSSYQFVNLSTCAGVTETDLNNILNDKGILAGKGSSFITAAKNNNLNEIYLVSHSLLETGNGTSKLATGVAYNNTTVYNMYGIGAIDSDPEGGGAKFAYDHQWFTPEAAIVGGAAFIGTYYIHAGQDTLYKMRWNPANPATHQYASDVRWAVNQVSMIESLYSQCRSYTLHYDIPVFQ